MQASDKEGKPLREVLGEKKVRHVYRWPMRGMLVVGVLCFCLPCWANNIQVVNIALQAQDTTNNYTHIEFDISWDNSWRTSSAPNNWDAAWVFAKWKLSSGSDWSHCTLSTSGTTAPVGSTIQVPDDGGSEGVGALIYRNSANGTGSNDWNNARLRWNYGTDSVADDATVDVRVYAIEMVYVPQGDYWLGDGFSTGTFRQTGSNTPVQITTTGVAVKCENTAYDDSQLEGGGIYVDGDGGINTSGASSPVNNADWPTGYGAFYVMKYEVSQGQYADFLSTLTDTQDDNRYYSSTSYRYTISGSYGNYSASVPNRACNYLSWADGAAYADWAGLRPLTELEYEKAGRGPSSAVAGEYAWGNANVASTAYIRSNDGQPNATVTNAASDPTGNASYSTTDGSIDGPLRCGIFATGSSSRIEAGAGYYGAMELSGNLFERSVTLGNETGRAFTGGHGNGALDASGNADVTTWPNTTAIGAGFRGGTWNYISAYLRVSYRYNAASSNANRYGTLGFRCARSAP